MRHTSRFRACYAGVLLSGWLLLGLCGSASASTGRQRTPARGRGPGDVAAQIVGGSDSDEATDPWLAYVTIADGRYTDSCTGTVISSNLILTAGHCVHDDDTGALYDPASYTVVTGSEDWTDPSSQVSGVTQTFLDGYLPTTDDHDVGILELSTPTTAPPIALASSSASLYPGNGVTIAGWGDEDASDNDSSPTQLQWAPTVTQPPAYCLLHNSQFDAATELCTVDAPYDDTSFCYGDSGGPVIANELQGEPGTPTEIGVINESSNCSTDQPDYSARVDAIAP